ncbi:MAG: acyl-ACP--UDP-N-acetylglucosamine O-acyltransferase [Sphingomonadales bacterium]|nr:acyl-ACP--UDP-N-acetylglucosamine O-acyltransferase [Sphingomonadales bacterium]
MGRQPTQVHFLPARVARALVTHGADDVVVGPFCVVGPLVRIGRGTVLTNSVTVVGKVTIGEGNKIFPGAVIGGDPQDLKYKGEPTRLVIGRGNTFRECVTIHRGTMGGGGETRIGDRNLFMAYAHVAHDCVIADRVIMTNNVMLGGHVTVGERAFLGGGSAVHQFCRIGRIAMVGGMARIVQDVVVGPIPTTCWTGPSTPPARSCARPA